MIEVQDLKVSFPILKSRERKTVLENFHLKMKEGEILGLVGESGSGKTVAALSIAGLLGEEAMIEKGTLFFEGIDLQQLKKKERRQMNGTKIGMIFQEPMTAFNPVLTIGKQVEEPLRLHTKLSAKERKERTFQMLLEVELKDPKKVYHSYPHELSGGMRQRAMIAMALILNPPLLIADEPTTALDVTIQEQMIKLLKKRNESHHTSILFISHNLGVVRRLCHRVLVMKSGRIQEEGQIEEIFEHPTSSYTKKLIEAIPVMKRE